MALKNVPFRSEVLAWNSDNLADYFRKLNYRDCEKAVKKYHIDGARFLNLTENDIQKFPKLRMPLLSKLSQDINKNEERRSIFTRKPQIPRFLEETESHEEDDGGWSSLKMTMKVPMMMIQMGRTMVTMSPLMRRNRPWWTMLLTMSLHPPTTRRLCRAPSCPPTLSTTPTPCTSTDLPLARSPSSLQCPH